MSRQSTLPIPSSGPLSPQVESAVSVDLGVPGSDGALEALQLLDSLSNAGSVGTVNVGAAAALDRRHPLARAAGGGSARKVAVRTASKRKRAGGKPETVAAACERPDLFAKQSRGASTSDVAKGGGRRSTQTRKIDPYPGCEFGCSACTAGARPAGVQAALWQLPRPSHSQALEAAELDGFSIEAVLRELGRRGGELIVGSRCDPYQPAERRFHLTRALLSTIEELVRAGSESLSRCGSLFDPGSRSDFESGESRLSLRLITKSPLVLSDLDLLTAIDARCAVTIEVPISSLQPELARRIEPHAPDPRVRLRTVERLALEGLAVVVTASPLLPGITTSEDVLEPLMDGARSAGAIDVASSPLDLSGELRLPFWQWLEAARPRLLPLYERLFRRSDRLDSSAADYVTSTFRRLRLAKGFPRAGVGRG